MASSTARRKSRDVRYAGRRTANGPVLRFLARAGLTARGVMYVVIGWIAAQIAFGHSRQQADRTGALHVLGGNRFGEVAPSSRHRSARGSWWRWPSASSCSVPFRAARPAALSTARRPSARKGSLTMGNAPKIGVSARRTAKIQIYPACSRISGSLHQERPG